MSEGRRRSFFVSGGTLPPDSASYIERSTDKLLLESLLAGRFCYVLNSRQLGKSSLSVHAIGGLRALGVRTAFVDLTRIGGKNVTAEQWYSGIALEIGRELGCRREAAVYWKENDSVAYVQRLFGMIRDVALDPARGESPLVIFIDEIDATRSLPFDADEFFAAIRECYNRRVSEPQFERLTFCLLGVAVPSDLVRNRAMTPFNIGERISLEDFTLGELSAYADVLGPKGTEIVSRVHYWTNGHPFLSQSLCRTIASQETMANPKQVDEVVQRELFDFKARDSNINLADVANIALHYGDAEPDRDGFRANLLSVYERVLQGREVVDDESNRAVVLLKLSGIVRTDGRQLHLRNRIYQKVFDRRWIEEHMPQQELRRQLQSYRRGVLRTALIGGSILAAVGAFAAVAWFSRIQAVKAEERLNYELYVADMNSLRHFYDKGDTGRIETILERHRNSPYRGFEWGYWLGRYHDSPEEYTLDYKAPGKRIEGHVSTDGREICLVDVLSGTATVVNRRTKEAVVTAKIDWPKNVVPLRSRWVQIKTNTPGCYKVIDLKTGKEISRLGGPNRWMDWLLPIEHSDLVATGERNRATDQSYINIWNAETGRQVFEIPRQWTDLKRPLIGQDPFNVSFDGRFAAYQRGPLGPVSGDSDGALKTEAVVIDLSSRKVVDRFPADSYTEFATRGFDGKWLFLQSRGRFYLRDVLRHRTIEWRPEGLSDWQLFGAVLTGDALVTLLDGGRCVVRDLAGQKQDVLRENVFSIAPGAEPGQYLASSNSVRLYNSRSSSSASVVSDGRRVTKYKPGILNLFMYSPTSAITRVTDTDFRKVGSIPNTGDASHYTYSGRWYLKGPPTAPVLVHAETGEEIALPLAPSIWSAGGEASLIAVWNQPDRKLVAYSGVQRRILWTNRNMLGVNSLWVSPDGTKLFAGVQDRDIRVFDMASGRVLGELRAHNYGLVYLTFSSDGRRVFTCGGDGAVVMWDAETLKQVMEFRGNDQDGMTSADLSPDGRRVVTSARSGSWQLWDAEKGVQVLDVHVSAAGLTSAVFLDKGHTIATAGDDGKVRLWRSADVDPTTHIPIDPSWLKGLHR